MTMANDNQIAVKKRLIYAEDLFEPVDCTVFVFGGQRSGKTMAMYEQLFRKRVEMAPTIDAVEVVHGRWIGGYQKCGNTFYYGEPHCSICGVKHEGVANYCPQCGAKMDLK